MISQRAPALSSIMVVVQGIITGSPQNKPVRNSVLICQISVNRVSTTCQNQCGHLAGIHVSQNSVCSSVRISVAVFSHV